MFLGTFDLGFVTTGHDPSDTADDGVEKESKTTDDNKGFPELGDIEGKSGATSGVVTKIFESRIGDGGVSGFDDGEFHRPRIVAGLRISIPRTTPITPAMA